MKFTHAFYVNIFKSGTDRQMDMMIPISLHMPQHFIGVSRCKTNL